MPVQHILNIASQLVFYTFYETILDITTQYFFDFSKPDGILKVPVRNVPYPLTYRRHGDFQTSSFTDFNQVVVAEPVGA